MNPSKFRFLTKTKLLFLAPAVIAVTVFVFMYGPKIKGRFLLISQNAPYQMPTPTPIKQGTFPPTPTPVKKTTPSASYVQPPTRILLPGAKWVPQTFNNCGPATVSMVLQYFGHQVSQEQTKAALRTNPTDTNVTLQEIQDYLLKQYNIDSQIFTNGDIQTIKTLLANGFYVVLESWLHPNEDIGHVTVIHGYDDEQGVLIADDSYIGVNITYKYEVFDTTQWKPFNRGFMPVFSSDKKPVLHAIIGKNLDEKTMYKEAVTRNQADINQNQNDMYAWFNLGTSYYGLKDYANAKLAYEKSRQIGWPRRMLWYQIQPVQTYNQLKEYQKALELANIGLAANDSFAELHLERAIAYKGLGDLSKSREEVNLTLSLYPNYQPAVELSNSF